MIIQWKEVFGTVGYLFILILFIAAIRFAPIGITWVTIKTQEAIYAWGSSEKARKKQRK